MADLALVAAVAAGALWASASTRKNTDNARISKERNMAEEEFGEWIAGEKRKPCRFCRTAAQLLQKP